MNKTLLAIVAVVVIAIGGYFVLRPAPEETQVAEPAATEEAAPAEAETVAPAETQDSAETAAPAEGEQAATETEIAALPPAGGELHIYNWGNYTNPKLIEKFEAANDIKVTLDSYDSNETMLAKVQAGGSGFDIVVPGDYMVDIMLKSNLLAKTEPNKMENFKNVDPLWVEVYWDQGRNYTVPWQWGTTSFTVDTAKYKGDINTLAVLFDPPQELCGRINMLTDMNDVINAGLRYLDLPRCNSNPDDLRKVSEQLLKSKACWRTFSYDTIQMMTSGDIDATQQWNGASMRVREQIPTAAYAYPKEGFTGWMDNVAVLADAPNMENAKKFQNFIMDPENAALISDFAKYANGVIGSDQFLPAEFANAPEIKMPDSAPAPEFVPPCAQEVVDKYNAIWTDLQK